MAMSDKLKPLAFLVQTDHQIIGTDADWWGRSKVMFKYLAWGIVGAAIMAGLYFGLPAIILGGIGVFAILLGAASGIGAALLITGLREAFHQHQTNPLSTAGKIAMGLMMLATVVLPFVAVPAWLIAAVVASCVFSIWPVVATALFFFKKNRVHTVVNVGSETAMGAQPTADKIYTNAFVALQDELGVAQNRIRELEDQSKAGGLGVAPAVLDGEGSFMSVADADAQLLNPKEITPLANAQGELRKLTEELSLAQSTIASLEAQVTDAKQEGQEEIAQLRAELVALRPTVADQDAKDPVHPVPTQGNNEQPLVLETSLGAAAVEEVKEDSRIAELEAELALKEDEILALTQKVTELEEVLSEGMMATSDGSELCRDDAEGLGELTDAQVIETLQGRVTELEGQLREAQSAQRHVSVTGIFKHGALKESDHHAAEMDAAVSEANSLRETGRKHEAAGRRTLEELETDHDRLYVANEQLTRQVEGLAEEAERLKGIERDCNKLEAMLKITYRRMLSFYALQTNTVEPTEAEQTKQLAMLFNSPDALEQLEALGSKLDQSLSPGYPYHHGADAAGEESGHDDFLFEARVSNATL